MSWLLAAYLGLVLIGLLVSISELRSRKHAYRAAMRSGFNGRRLLVASSFVRAEWARLWILACLFAMGVNAMQPQSRQRSILAVVAFTCAALGVIVSALISRYDRLLTYDAEDQADHADPPEAA